MNYVNFFKKNSVFFSFCIAALLVFIIAGILLVIESGKLAKAKEKGYNLKKYL